MTAAFAAIITTVIAIIITNIAMIDSLVLQKQLVHHYGVYSSLLFMNQGANLRFYQLYFFYGQIVVKNSGFLLIVVTINKCSEK